MGRTALAVFIKRPQADLKSAPLRILQRNGDRTEVGAIAACCVQTATSSAQRSNLLPVGFASSSLHVTFITVVLQAEL